MPIGRISTPWQSRVETPRQGRQDGPTCRIEVFEPWVTALTGLAQFERIEVLYWLHLSRRDLVLQSPANDGTARGTFSLRSPARPNPIGTSIAQLLSIDGATVLVRGLDCLDGAPLLDIKPDRALFKPIDLSASGWRLSGRRSVAARSEPRAYRKKICGLALVCSLYVLTLIAVPVPRGPVSPRKWLVD